MKRITAALLALILLLSLAACGEKPAEIAQTPAPAETAAPTPAPTPEPAPVLIMTELELCREDRDSLMSMDMDDDTLCALIFGHDDSSYLQIYSLSDGSMKTVDFGPVYDDANYPCTVRILDDGSILALFGSERCRVRRISAAGEVLGECFVPDWDNAFYPTVDPVTGKIWYTDPMGDFVSFDPISGESGSCSLEREDGSWQYLDRVYDDKLIISSESGSRIHDSVSGEESFIGSFGVLFNTTDYGAFMGNYSRMDSDLGNSGVLYIDYAEPDKFIYIENAGTPQHIGPGGTLFCTELTDTELILRAIDPEGGLLLAEKRMDTSSGLGYPFAIVDNGSSLAFETFDNSGSRDFIWHYGLEEPRPLEAVTVSAEELPERIEELAAEIQAISGFTVHAMPGDTPPTSYDYSFNTDHSLFDAYTCLLSIRDQVSLYPEVMLMQVAGDNSHIYLTASFNTVSESALETVSGLAYISDNNEQVVVLTARQPDDLAHELMHIIEDDLYRRQMYNTGTDYMGGWYALNPQGFDYYWSYEDYELKDDADKYCDIWTSPDEAYFIDSYSKTFPGEDRSRIFEYLFFRDTDYFSDCPNIMAKAQYLCALLREVYGYEEAVWERGIDVPEISSYDEMVQAYLGSLVAVG